LLSFRPVNMNTIPEDLADFDFTDPDFTDPDFTSSSCALEHLGDLNAGRDFVYRSLDCLKQGGVAVHTTEFTVDSNESTVSEGPTVVYRRQDIERIVDQLNTDGHEIDVTFGLGTTPEDRHIDVVPFTNTHLKVRLEEHVITGIGLAIRKAREF
jgi:hypothetical protein